jgi:hypothetical protein
MVLTSTLHDMMDFLLHDTTCPYILVLFPFLSVPFSFPISSLSSSLSPSLSLLFFYLSLAGGLYSVDIYIESRDQSKYIVWLDTVVIRGEKLLLIYCY